MIEECEDILECENKLSLISQKVKLLGKFPLSIEEVDKLGAFIKKQISENIQKGTEFLKTKTPTCFACFLVWKGILDYRDGDYWSGFREFAGLSDPNWQAKWGKTFINFLESNGLSCFDNIKDAHRYVTPILMHGMIPNSCLDEFFEKILLPIVKQDLTDPSYLRFLLKIRREADNERYAIEKEISELRAKKGLISSRLTRVSSLIKIWDDLDKIKALEVEVGDPDELVSLPENPFEYRSKKKFAIQSLQKEIGGFKKKERQYEQEIEDYSKKDKQVLVHSDGIVQCINILPELEQEVKRATDLKARETLLKDQLKKHAESIFSERWDERYGEIIRNLPFDKLKEKIEELCSRKANESSAEQRYLSNIVRIIKKWATYILSFFTKQGGKTDQELYAEIREMLRGLPIDEAKIEQLQTDLVQSLILLKDTYENLCQLSENRKSLEGENRERINKIKNVVEAVGVNITDNIGHMVTVMQDKLTDSQKHKKSANQTEQEIKKIKICLKELGVKEQSLAKELQEIDERLAKLGNGDIQSGIEELKHRRDAQLKAESLRNNLMRVYPDFDSLEREKDEAQKDGKDKSYYNSEIYGLDVKIKQTKQRVTELEEKLNQIPVPFPNVDEPIRRFLLYGGDTATDFLIQSIQMVNQITEEQEIPSADEIGLPERVVTRFEKWWEEHDITDGEGGEDEIIGLKRFRRPVIYLDTAIAEIRVHFPSQRFSILEKSTRFCLIINEGEPESHKEQLKVYRYDKDFLETDELDFSLLFPLAHYEFTLKNGSQVIRSWDTEGISQDHPFMAFHYDSKKLIKGVELPKEKIWILLHNRFDLEPSRIILEEASLYGKWKEYQYQALDLSDVRQLDLVDKQGEKKSIPISQKKVFEPRLCGGQVLRGCRSEEKDIYVGEPPSICIPIESDAEIRGWIISIPKDNDSTLDESKHYRLYDLEEILNINVNEGICKIPLSNEKCLGKSPVGKLTVRLRNDTKNTNKRFCFCVVPHLKVGFNKDIYLPCEENTSQVYLTLNGSEQMEFEPQSPAKIIDHKDSSYGIETASSEHSIHGILRYPFSNRGLISIPITIEIPRLTWRLDGLQNNKYFSESNKIEEIWFGDWEKAEESLFLIVDMPPLVCGQGQLSLCNSERRSEAKITEGKARFDLLGFSDTLRAGDEPLQTFELTVPNSEPSIDNVELFKVRTKWEVEEIECVQKFYNGMLILNISWKKEKGEPKGQRVVRLWKIWEPGSDPFTMEIPEGACSIEISEKQVELPPGDYRIHIDVEDLWSATKSSIPPPNSLNTTNIQVQEEILQGKINITSVIDKDDQTYRLNYRYSIQIDGKIISGKLPTAVGNNDTVVKKINEGWYVGEMSVTTRARVETAMDWINPVKFEYDSRNNCIETIENKEGDGAYFCPLCKKLFWSNKHYEKEKEKGHEKDLLTENIKFKIKNKP